MLDIYVIGCGGIGGYLLQLLPAAIVSCTLDAIDHSIEGRSAQLLNQDGNRFVPCLANRLVLIDGDNFDPHNAIRQAAGAGSKLAVQMQLLQQSMLKRVWLRQMQLFGIDTYIRPTNIAEIIPQKLYSPMPYAVQDTVRAQYNRAIDLWLHDVMKYTRYPTRVSAQVAKARIIGSQWDTMDQAKLRPSSIPVVFLCVDNHKTRYQVHKYMETFSDCILINGGNSKLAGNATIYQKRKGQQLDPKLYQLYPQVMDQNSKRPDQLACTQVSRQHDQIAVVNSMLAAIMCNLFRKAISPTDSLDIAGRNGSKRLNEVIVQCTSMTMVPQYHKPKTKE